MKSHPLNFLSIIGAVALQLIFASLTSVQEPRVSIDKTVNPETLPVPGGTVTFQIRINVNSTKPLTLISLMDDVHGNLDGKGTCSTPQILPQTGKYECSFNALVTGRRGDIHTDVISAVLRDAEGNSIIVHDSAMITIGADLICGILVSKVVTPTSVIEPSGVVTFTFRLPNYCLVPTTLTSLTDDFLGDLNGQGTCLLPQTIEVQGSYACTVVSEITGSAHDYHLNSVTATVIDASGNAAVGSDTAVVFFTEAPTPEMLFLPIVIKNRQLRQLQ